MSRLLKITKRIVPASVKRRFSMKTKESVKRPIVALSRGLRRLTARRRALPDFIIAGAQKCGTTTMYDQLCRHPMVVAALQKELNFFHWHHGRGMGWYRSNFPLTRALARAGTGGERAITGEATPCYMFFPRTFERIAQAVPDARIIIMLRNPVDRAYSSYQHQVWKSREQRTFEEAIDAEPKRLAPEIARMAADEDYFSTEYQHFSYLARGLYREQIERCYRHFPRDRVLIVGSERFFSDNEAVYLEVCDFLGLPPHRLDQYKNATPTDYRQMHPDTRQRLVEYYRPHNARLYAFLGRRFDWDR